VLFHALGWVEAVRPGSSQPPPGKAPSLESLPLRAQLRAEAHRQHRPFLELDGPDETARIFGTLPDEPARALAVPWRREPRLFASSLVVLALEALTRRLRRRSGDAS